MRGEALVERCLCTALDMQVGEETRPWPHLPSHARRGACRGFVLYLSDGPESSAVQRTRHSAPEGQLCGVTFSPEPPSRSGFSRDHTRGRVRPRGGAAPRPRAAGTLTCTSQRTGTLGAAAGGKAVDSARVPRPPCQLCLQTVGFTLVVMTPCCGNRDSWDMGRPILWGCSWHSSPSEVPLHTS